MADYEIVLRFPAPDDEAALRRAAPMAGGIVADWADNRVRWHSVRRADGTHVRPAPGDVDPVLVSAAWGGAAEPITDDEEMREVVARVVAALGEQAGRDRAALARIRKLRDDAPAMAEGPTWHGLDRALNGTNSEET